MLCCNVLITNQNPQLQILQYNPLSIKVQEQTLYSTQEHHSECLSYGNIFSCFGCWNANRISAQVILGFVQSLHWNLLCFNSNSSHPTFSTPMTMKQDLKMVHCVQVLLQPNKASPVSYLQSITRTRYCPFTLGNAVCIPYNVRIISICKYSVFYLFFNGTVVLVV